MAKQRGSGGIGPRLVWITCLAGGLAWAGNTPANAATLELATFRVDVTPPIGEGPCVGCMPKVNRVEHPLELRGLVLRTGDGAFVIAAIDFCGICNSSDDHLRQSSAAEAQTPVLVSELTPREIGWSSAEIRFTVREHGAFDPNLLKSQLRSDQPFTTRLTAAMFSGFSQRLRAGYVARATRLRIGPLDLVHLPGEPFVEFQLFAQEQVAQDQARQDRFVCVAGYGECGVWYYGPDRIFTDRGGYEQTWSVTGPCEESVQTAIRQVLAR